jgi:hypothetical protein
VKDNDVAIASLAESSTSSIQSSDLVTEPPATSDLSDQIEKLSITEVTTPVIPIAATDPIPPPSSTGVVDTIPSSAPLNQLDENEFPPLVSASVPTVTVKPSTTAVTSPPPVSVSAPSSSTSSHVTSFQSYMRTNRLGFERLTSPRNRELNILDCLGAYTDQELLTGNNKYGCKNCSQKADERNSKKEKEQSEVPSDSSIIPSSPPPLLAEPDLDKTFSETKVDTADSASSPVESISPSISSPPPPPLPIPSPVTVKSDAVQRCQILVPPNILTLHLKR